MATKFQVTIEVVFYDELKHKHAYVHSTVICKSPKVAYAVVNDRIERKVGYNQISMRYVRIERNGKRVDYYGGVR